MGAIAALMTSVCWAGSSIFFTLGGKEVGSVMVNRIRIVFALLLVMLAHQVTRGAPFPLDAGWDRWFWLGLSGMAGLVLGDSFMFQAYVLVGTRIGTLLMAFAPVIGALIAWVFLDEKLTPFQIGGIGLAITGIALVVLEKRNGGDSKHDLRRYILGMLCGLGGALGQASGLVLAKKGLAGNFPPISGVVIRMLIAMIAIWAVAVVFRQVGRTLQASKNRQALRPIVLGSVVGPFMGVWFSLIAVQLTLVGIASTLMAMTPILVLPLSKWVFKEEVTPRAIAGTVVALTGVAVIFLTT
jgi:drug/metabolite transporter (DMT)-like permease